MDLDPVNFTDEVFQSYASVKPNSTADGSTGNKKVRDAEVNTMEIYY